MSAKLVSLALVSAIALVAGRGLSNAAERHAPATERRAAATQPALPAPPPSAPVFEPAKAFNELGCSGCHGDDGIYRDEIKGAIGKPVEQVARWIRNAPSIKRGTDMPSFETLIDVPNSVALAGWVVDRAAHLD